MHGFLLYCYIHQPYRSNINCLALCDHISRRPLGTIINNTRRYPPGILKWTMIYFHPLPFHHHKGWHSAWSYACNICKKEKYFCHTWTNSCFKHKFVQKPLLLGLSLPRIRDGSHLVKKYSQKCVLSYFSRSLLPQECQDINFHGTGRSDENVYLVKCSKPSTKLPCIPNISNIFTTPLLCLLSSMPLSKPYVNSLELLIRELGCLCMLFLLQF